MWLPFYRAHANLGTDRREPYLFPEDVQERLRSAMRLRYAHIPVFYTLFFEHYRYGTPVIRPLFYHYPQLNAVLDIDNQLLVGELFALNPHYALFTRFDPQVAIFWLGQFLSPMSLVLLFISREALKSFGMMLKIHYCIPEMEILLFPLLLTR